MKTVKYFLAAAVLSCSVCLKAQENKVKPELKMKLILEDDENGNVTRFDSTFSIEDKEKVRAILKEKGIEWDLNELNFDELNSNSIHKKMNFKVKDFDFEDGESVRFEFKELESEGTAEKELNIEAIIQEAKDAANESLKGEFESEGASSKVIMIKREISFDELDEEYEIKDEGIERVFIQEIKVDGDDSMEVEEILESLKAMVFIVDSENTFEVDEIELPTEIIEEKLENLEITKLKLFPNPTTGHFNMSFKSKSEKDILISIIDLNGKLVYEKELKQFKGKFNEDFDLSSHEKGIYFFNIVTGNEKETRKVIVQ